MERWRLGYGRAHLSLFMEAADRGELLSELNGNPNLDFLKKSANYFEIDELPNPYSSVNIDSIYYDLSSFEHKFKNDANSLILSVNIQSLNSKFSNLNIFVNQLLNSGVNIEIIALQETWHISQPNLYQISCFNFVSQSRSFGIGGGVGLYIRD